MVKKETVRISDDYSTLSQTLDDLLADEGFAELDIDSPKVITQLILISVTSLRIYWNEEEPLLPVQALKITLLKADRAFLSIMLSSQAFEAEGAYSGLKRISNGNRTAEWTSIRSVTIRVINKIDLLNKMDYFQAFFLQPP